LFREQCIFEIAIYRISYEQFNKNYDTALQHHLKKFQELSGLALNKIPESNLLHTEQHFWENYGGPWNYNQVIGWIRLYIFGSQIRGELWKMVGKKFTRKTRNQFQFIGKIIEIDCMTEDNSEQILEKVENELDRIKKELIKKKRSLDLQCFKNLASYIDWRKLMDNKKGKEINSRTPK